MFFACMCRFWMELIGSTSMRQGQASMSLYKVLVFLLSPVKVLVCKMDFNVIVVTFLLFFVLLAFRTSSFRCQYHLLTLA